MLKPIKQVAILVTVMLFSNGIYAQNWDINLLEDINPQYPNSAIWKGVSNTTYPISFGLPVGMFIYATIEKDKPAKIRAYEMAGSVVLAAASSQALKIIINRDRPYIKYNTVYPYEIENDNSLPSTHTAVAFAMATTLSMQYKKWYVVVPSYAWASAVGYSRLYLGEHYPTDVLAGAVTGAGSAIISHIITKKIFK